MSNRPAFAVSIGLVAASILAEPAEAARQTQCRGSPGREFIGYVIPNVPLAGGIRTGMTKAQVKRIAPLLSLDDSRQQLELFPGLSFRATIMFSNWVGGVEWLRLFGPWQQTPIKPLTAHYGEPITLEVYGMGFDRVRVLKWCDGLRVLVLTEQIDRFAVKITSERVFRR